MRKIFACMILGSLMLLSLPGKAGPPGLDQRTMAQFIVNAHGGPMVIQVVDKAVIAPVQWNLTAVEMFGASDCGRPPTESVGYSMYKEQKRTEFVKIPICAVLRC